MAEKQDLHCYLVSLQWSDGGGTLLAGVWGSPSQAGAHAAEAALRSQAPPKGNLVAAMHTEVSLEWLRWAVRCIEGGTTEAAPVLSLVPQKPGSEPLTPAQGGAWPAGVQGTDDPPGAT